MANWPTRVAALTGWRRYAAAALCGLLVTAALPPLYLVPLAFAGFAGLIWLLNGARGWRPAVLTGWAFGTAHCGSGFYWISSSLLVDAERFGWLYPISITFFGIAFGIYPALVALAHHRIGRRCWRGGLVFAALWTIGEGLRGHLFTGFPWNLIGTVWAVSDASLQLGSIVGTYGLSLLTVAVAGLLASLRPVPMVFALALIAAQFGFGLLRLADATMADVPGVRLRLVQPDIPQDLKWEPALREAHFTRTLTVSRAPGLERVTHVIWPEAAIPFAIGEDAPRRARLAEIVPDGGLLIAGAPRVERTSRPIQVYNSLFAFDRAGTVVATYDKFHLVPFGEFMPLRWLLGWLPPIASIGDTAAGPGARTMTLAGLTPFSPMICYEIIFPGAVVAPGPRPGFLLNLTNDAWFGLSAGPFQHFASARLRAVEEGLPLVRAANNGISAIVDAHGRVRASLALGASGVVDGPLPVAIESTVFARTGNLGAWALAALVLFAGLIPNRTKKS